MRLKFTKEDFFIIMTTAVLLFALWSFLVSGTVIAVSTFRLIVGQSHLRPDDFKYWMYIFLIAFAVLLILADKLFRRRK